MTPCSVWDLAQYVADGEPDTPAYAGLRHHLASCPRCCREIVTLRKVEEALSTMPLCYPDTTFTARVMRAIALDVTRHEPWILLPWAIWLPFVSLVIALLILLITLPGVSTSALAVISHETRLLLKEPTWLSGIDFQDDMFWIAWSVVFAMLAGLGVRMSLRSWQALNSRSLDHLEEQVSDAAHRLWDAARRAL